MAGCRLTDRAVAALKPAARDTFVWDAQLRGFGVKLTPAGKRVYLLQYRMGGRGTTTRRYTIGEHGAWRAATARAEAERLIRLVATGSDPRDVAQQLLDAQQLEAERVRSLEFEAYSSFFLERYAQPRWRPRTYTSAVGNLRRWIVPVLKGKALPKIGKQDIAAVIDRVPASSPALPRSLFALMRRIFSWAVQRGDIDLSPMDRLEVPLAAHARERVLSDDELPHVAGCTLALGEPFGSFVRMLILTGQRRDEVAAMTWDELDRETALWTLPSHRVKNKIEHRVPLHHIAIRALDAVAGSTQWPTKGFVFTTNGRRPVSGFSKLKLRLDTLVTAQRGSPLAPWRLHDLRRTFATNMQRLGVRFEVTEALLNHLTGARSGVAGVYQRYDWAQEKREAIELWADKLGRMVINRLQARL